MPSASKSSSARCARTSRGLAVRRTRSRVRPASRSRRWCASSRNTRSACRAKRADPEEPMAAILGLGMTHFPPLAWRDAYMADILKALLGAPGVPAPFKDRSRWPREMLAELANDEGLGAAVAHRAAMLAEFRRMRERLDEFRPHFVVIFGDDQYENFREDVVPPFCVLALEEIETRPFASGAAAMRPNVWGEA